MGHLTLKKIFVNHTENSSAIVNDSQELLGMHDQKKL